MADKQATIFVIDLGKTTREIHNGRTESNLEYGLQYFWAKVLKVMATNRSTLSIGVIAFRTDETKNPLAHDGYQNISILAPLGVMDLAKINHMKFQLTPSRTTEGDALSAIVVAISEMEKFTNLKSGKPGKFIRKIILLTDGEGFIDDEGSDEIAKKINESGIEMIIVGIDFDDAEFGFKEEDKSLSKLESEKILKDFVKKCEKGLFGTAAAAIEQISEPSVKVTKPYVTYEGRLTIGDIDKYPETTCCVDVKRYFKVKKAKPPTTSAFVSCNPVTPGGTANPLSQVEKDEIDLSPVKNSRTYKVNDPTVPRGKKDVPYENLVKGYQYGRTIVPINDSDRGITDLQTLQSFTIIGFIIDDRFEKYLSMGESCITIANPVSEKSQMAMSSFVHALYELELNAVARIVPKNGMDPSILLLAPHLKPGEVEALIDVPLPFNEDIRPYPFPPLDKVITVSGVVLTEHPNLPSADLLSAMSDYVDAMDLSDFGKDDYGSPLEYLSVEETYNPVLHHISRAISQRALFPNRPVLTPSEELTKWSKIPPKLVSNASQQFQKLISIASLKEVPPKVMGKRERRDTVKPLSGLDVDALFSGEKRQKI